MKKYCIYVVKQRGNIGPHEIKRIDAPSFDLEKDAETHLLDLIEKREGHYFERNWNHFVILPTYQSKNAFYLADKNKNFEFIEGIPLDTAAILRMDGLKTLNAIEKCTYKELLEKFDKIPGFIEEVDLIIKKFHLNLKS